MRATSLGHAGILIETDLGSIVCDPWFVPAFLGSWFVFPRNDQLSADLMDRVCNPTYLYISHQHGDHLDEAFLRQRMNKDVTVLLPGFPTRELERQLSRLGFHRFVRTTNGIETELSQGLSIAIHIESSISDGPGGDSALVVSDGKTRLVNQNDCRTGDLGLLTSHGPVDLHYLQFSGAIWYPMVYDMPVEDKRALAKAKVESQFARAEKYVESVAARVVLPSAGPPCFLDEKLFHLNMFDPEDVSIFPDQTAFIDRLAKRGVTNPTLNVPGTCVEISPTEFTVAHPSPRDTVMKPFTDKKNYLRQYQSDWARWLAQERQSWPHDSTDLATSMQAWWEPLFVLSPTLRKAIGGSCRITSGEADLIIDFERGEVRQFAAEAVRYRFEIPRPLLEKVVRDRAVDWSNSLFLSCRFSAWREGEFNEFLYNFFKSLSVERIRRAEEEASRRTGVQEERSDEIELGDFIMQRKCPHRSADLSEFGVIQGEYVVCTLHGWKFRTSDGACMNAEDRSLKIRSRN
ncbi:MAG: Rieske 2Fe-2S domain-containing protein [Actinomycetota bacterium]